MSSNDKTQGHTILRHEVQGSQRPLRRWVLAVRVPVHDKDGSLIPQLRHFEAEGTGVLEILAILENMGLHEDVLPFIEWAALPMQLGHGEEAGKLVMGNGSLVIDLMRLSNRHGGQLTPELLRSLNPKRKAISRDRVKVVFHDPSQPDPQGMGCATIEMTYDPPSPGTLHLTPHSVSGRRPGDRRPPRTRAQRRQHRNRVAV